jgi:phosphate transport system protein
MPPTEHISKQYDSDLEGIRTRVLQMGGLVEAQIVAAMEGVSNSNSEALDRVLADERRVNDLELQIDEECAHIIARRQPTARDLRLIMSISKAVTDLERIGDEAFKIARMGKQLLARERIQIPRLADVTFSANRATGMLRSALDAYARLDAAAAERIIREDKMIDGEFRAILRQLVTFMMEDPRTISSALDIIWIAKAVERIGDHAKNISQYVIFIVDGVDVRHASSLEP